jgi:hypothetical protein
MNACAERIVRSVKAECLDRMIVVGQGSLENDLTEYVEHYHRERAHQGIGNELIDGGEPSGAGQIEVSERLGGLLKFYDRRAA